MGAAHLIDYNTEDIPARVREITNGRGVDAILDTVSSDSATAGLEMLAFNGSIACVAGLPDFTKIRPFTKAISIHEVALGIAHSSGDKIAIADLGRMGRELGTLVSEKKISPMLEEVISLEAVPDALVRLKARHVRGKIVAQIQS